MTHPAAANPIKQTCCEKDARKIFPKTGLMMKLKY